MKTRSLRRGFSYVELLFVLGMIGVLAAISLPRYFRAQTYALQSEATTNLKSLATTLRTQQSVPYSIHVHDFNPPRGNRYSYHTQEPCLSYESRQGFDAVRSAYDRCIGVDVFEHPTLPELFSPVLVTDYFWQTATHSLSNTPGYFGACGDLTWDFIAYAAGDVDDVLYGETSMDGADSWIVSSSDGFLAPVCPATGSTFVPAGEPFMVYDDASCN